MKKEEIKNVIKATYGAIANSSNKDAGCCTTVGCCGTNDLISMKESYDGIEGYHKEADLELGCGLPTEIANIKEGDTVIDLGSGAGNDAFIARQIVGVQGKVIGIDMTPEMVLKAKQNNQKFGYNNVEFILDEIENMQTIPENSADVVISNCVMNLVPNKQKALKEVFRTLKDGGHFSISDIVSVGKLPKGILEAAELYAGCVSGASEKGNYLGIIKSVGFKNIVIKKERAIEIPDNILLNYISSEELFKFKNSDAGIYSITIYADKLEDGECCNSTENECCGSELATNEIADKSSCCNSSKTTSTGCC